MYEYLGIGVAHAQNTAWLEMIIGRPGGQSGWVAQLADLTVVLLSTLALVVFIWGVVVFIAQGENETAREEGKKKMVFGVLGLFAIVTLWGIVYLVQVMLGVNTQPGTSPTEQLAPSTCAFGECPEL
jgi:hypothetical protein